MTTESFWGLPVTVGTSPVQVNLAGKCLHVTQLAIGSGKGRVRLEVSTKAMGNRRMTLATLNGKSPQAVVDVTFFAEDGVVSFYADGSEDVSLHLTGVMVSETSKQGGQSNGTAHGTAEMVAADIVEDESEDEDFQPGAGDDESADDDEDGDEADSIAESGDDDDDSEDDDVEDDDEGEEDSDSEEEEVAPVKAPASKKKRKVKEECTTPAKKAKSNDVEFRTQKSGLKIAVCKEGKGNRLTPGHKLKLRYTASLTQSGEVFDGNLEKSDAPLAFRCGLKKVIPGIDEGVLGMRVGEVRKLQVPPTLGYGKKGIKGTIPPNATLTFDIERVG